jgi:hypothetical protein
MTASSCLQDPHIRAAFERSNIEQSEWEHNARQLDFLLSSGFQPSDIEEVSVVEAYRKPDGSSMGSVTHLLTLMFPGVALLREAGLLRKRTDVQEFLYSEFPGGTFVAEEAELGRGWGVCAIQARVGSVPLFRLGWHWSAGHGQSRELMAVAAERDRILSSMQRSLEVARP